jgi:hypothetical protein
VSRRTYRADYKSLINLEFSAKNSGFSIPCGGKFARAAIGDPLKMMDVGSLSGDPTPGRISRHCARWARLVAGAFRQVSETPGIADPKRCPGLSGHGSLGWQAVLCYCQR